MSGAEWRRGQLAGSGVQTAAASRMGVPKQRVSEVIKGVRPFNAPLAARMIRAGWPRDEVEQAYLAECRGRLARLLAELDEEGGA